MTGTSAAIANAVSFRWGRSLAILVAALSCLPGVARAGDEPGADRVSQANNPLASFTAFVLQDYYIGELTDQDEEANQFWVRLAKPFSIGETNWLMRASLPVNTYPVAPSFSHESGIGDFNVFAAWLIDTGNPAVSFGVGPQITAPTATEDPLGSEKWSAGFANVLFNASSKVFQYGYLLTWQASFAGEDDRDDVNLGALQPFLFYQLGGGTYLRSTGVMAYDFERNGYSVPIGFGIGQVIPRGNATFNLYVEPQVSIADKGAGWPEWQVFLGASSQFR